MPALSPDLVYYCGQSLPWDPRSKDLGRSEQAVVELARHWVQAGLNVEVYGSIPEGMICDGVIYRPMEQAQPILRADVVVLWRLYGLMGFWKGLHRFQCRLLAVDFHDRELFGHEELFYQSRHHLGALMFKSQFHAEFLLGKLPAEKQAPLRKRVKVIPNGIRKQDFTLTNPQPREPHRFCYASCYLRGLVPLIHYFWPEVRRIWPDAELHVYYGMENVRDPGSRQAISQALQAEGVYEHGRQPVSVISEEKHRSSFHLYYTNSLIETDCISIKESAYAGCIPIISGVNVFAERSGVVMPGDAVTEQDYRQAAQAFVNWVQKTSEAELEKIRQSLHAVKTHQDWQQTAQRWRRGLGLVPASMTWEMMGDIYKDDLAKVEAAVEAVSPSSDPSIHWKIGSIQYINLASSKSRAAWMEAQLAKTCPKELIRRLDAVVGKTHCFTDQEAGFFKDSDFKDGPHFKNIAGNCLSHLSAWELAASQPDNLVTVVLQDDAILVPDFMNCLGEALKGLPSDALVLFVSDHIYASRDRFVPVDLENQDLQARQMAMKENINSLVSKHVDEWADHCSLAYVITPRGAREMVRSVRRYGFLRATDRFLRDVAVSHGRNYASIRCLATSSSDKFKSDVWSK